MNNSVFVVSSHVTLSAATGDSWQFLTFPERGSKRNSDQG